MGGDELLRGRWWWVNAGRTYVTVVGPRHHDLFFGFSLEFSLSWFPRKLMFACRENFGGIKMIIHLIR